MNPAHAREARRTVQLNGIDLSYEVFGRGEPLLLLHGMTGCGRDWRHAGLEDFARRYEVIAIDARGHGHSTNPGKTFSHAQCARDLLGLLDHLGLERCKAIGLSMGGNTLLHAALQAALQGEVRIDAMVVVSAAMHFPEQARRIMRQVPAHPPDAERLRLRESHAHGDEQIATLWGHQRALAESHDDMSFTPPSLSRITARTLVVHGDRDPLYPVEMAVEMHRAIPNSALWVVPQSRHVPVFLDAAARFVETSLAFLGASPRAERSA